MATLRERQKENRRRKILEVACAQMVARGFDATTIETIADGAEVSAVTVYNYYGTKTGLLLALVAQSDSILLDRMEFLRKEPPDSLVETLSAFATIIRDHALDFLTKPIWRQVIAASVVEGSTQFAKSYARLDRDLARKLTEILQKLQASGQLNADVDLDILGDSLWQLQNARFVQFISHDDLSSESVDRYLREDLQALLCAAPGAGSASGRT